MKLICLALVSLPMCLLADGGMPSQPYIYVEAQAEAQKPADFVGLNFRVVGRAGERPKANEQVQEKVLKAFALLKEAKIADSDIIAEDLSSEPEHDATEFARGRNKLVGYTVTRPVYVKVRDINIFPTLVDRLIGLGGIEFARIEGGLSKQDDVEEEMKEQALTNARQRAEKTVATMGMKIDSVFAVSPVRFPELVSKLFSSDRQVVVHVIYLISPAK